MSSVFDSYDQKTNTNIANTTFNEEYINQLKTNINTQISFLRAKNSIPDSQHVTENSSFAGMSKQLDTNNYIATGESTMRPAGIVNTAPQNDIRTPTPPQNIRQSQINPIYAPFQSRQINTPQESKIEQNIQNQQEQQLKEQQIKEQIKQEIQQSEERLKQQQKQELDESKKQIQQDTEQKINQQTEERIKQIQTEIEQKVQQQTQQEIDKAKQNIQKTTQEQIQQTKQESQQETEQKINQQTEEKIKQSQQTTEQKIQQQTQQEIDKTKRDIQIIAQQQIQQTKQELQQDTEQKINQQTEEKIKQSQQKTNQKIQQQIQQEIDKAKQDIQKTAQEQIQQTKQEPQQEIEQKFNQQTEEIIKQIQAKTDQKIKQQEIDKTKQDIQKPAQEQIQQTKQEIEQDTGQKINQQTEERIKQIQLETDQKIQQKLQQDSKQKNNQQIEERIKQIQSETDQKIKHTQQQLNNTQLSNTQLNDTQLNNTSLNVNIQSSTNTSSVQPSPQIQQIIKEVQRTVVHEKETKVETKTEQIPIIQQSPIDEDIITIETFKQEPQSSPQEQPQSELFPPPSAQSKFKEVPKSEPLKDENITPEEQNVRESIVGTNIILKGLIEQSEDIKSQISKIEDETQKQIISGDVSSDLKIIEDLMIQIGEVMENVQNINEHTDLSDLSEQIKQVSDSIKKDIDFNDVLQKIQDNYEDIIKNVDKQTASELGKQFTQLQDVLTVFQLIPDYLNNNIDLDSLKTFLNLINKIKSSAQEAGDIVSDVADDVSNLSDNINDLSDQTKFEISAAEQIKESIKNVSEHVKLLRQQYNDSIKAVDEVGKVTDVYLRDVQDEISENVNDFLQKIITLAREQKIDDITKLFNPDEAGSFGEIPKTIMEFVTQLNETAKTAAEQDNGLESMVGMIQGINKFSVNTIDILKYMVENLEEIGKNTDNNEILKTADSLSKKIEEIQKVQDNTMLGLYMGLNDMVLRQSSKIIESLKNVNKPGTEEHKSSSMDLAQKFTDTSIQNIGYAGSNLQNAANALMMGDAYQDAGQHGLFYRKTVGNFLKNRKDFSESVESAQRTNIKSQQVLPEMFDKAKQAKASGDTEGFKKYIENIAKIANENALSHTKMMKNINLHRGQYDKLSQQDKDALDSSISSSENAAQSLSQVIAALSQLDPENKSLDMLKKTNRELLNTTQHIKDIKSESNPISEIFKSAVSGVKSVMGAITAGAGLMGLGAIIPTVSNIKGFVQRSFESYKNDGQRRYDLSRARQAMDASINPADDSYLINTLADRYYEMSVGNIGFDQVKNFYTNLAYNVGGHYGSNPQQASSDMQEITNNTFALAYSYNMSDNDVSNFMKTYYKDMRMSVTDASYMMVRLAQSAQQAGIPVANYISALTNMTSSLREYGMSAEGIAGMMDTLINNQGLRIEDAQGLVTDTANANRNMANDWGMSGFFGMVSGQSGDFFGNIAAGLTPIDSQGNVNKGWSQMMTQRLFTETGLMGGIGGGPGSPLGAMMVSNQLNKRGYSQRSVSMLTDAYANNDMKLFQTLLEQAEEEKDGAQEKLTKAMQDAEKSITTSGTQMSGISKIETQLRLAEKKLGEAIYTHLDKPLANFRDTYKKGLAIVVGALKRVAKALGEFFNSDMGQKVLSDPKYLVGGAVGAAALWTGGKWAAGKAWKSVFGSSTGKAAKGGSSILKSLSSLAKTGGGKFALIAAALAGIHFLVPKIIDIFTGKGFLATITDLWEGLKSFFGFGSSNNLDFKKDVKKNEKEKNEESLFDELAKEGGWEESKTVEKSEQDFEKQTKEILDKHSDVVKDYKTHEGGFETRHELEKSEVTKETEENIKQQSETKTESNKEQTQEQKNTETKEENKSELTKKTEEDVKKQSEERYEKITKNKKIKAGMTSSQDFKEQEKQAKEAEQSQDIMTKSMKAAVLKYGNMSEEELADRYSGDEEALGATVANYGITMGAGIAGAYAYQRYNKNMNQIAQRNARHEVIKNTKNEINRIKTNAQSGRWGSHPLYQKGLQQDIKNIRSQGLANAKSAAASATVKSLGMKTLIGGAAKFAAPIAVVSEVAKAYNNPDQFTMGQRMARVGIDVGSSIVGAVAGTLIGGPVGTAVGIAGGAVIGEGLKKLLKLSDSDGKTYAEKYEKSSTFAAGKYTENTESLVNSNDARRKAVEDGLSEHNIELTRLTKDQQAKLDQIFNELKRMGLSDLQAAAAAGSTLGGVMSEQAKAAIGDDKKVLAAIDKGLKDGGLKGFDEELAKTDPNKAALQDQASKYRTAKVAISKDEDAATRNVLYEILQETHQYKDSPDLHSKVAIALKRKVYGSEEGGEVSLDDVQKVQKFVDMTFHKGDYKDLTAAGKSNEEWKMISGLNGSRESFDFKKDLEDKYVNKPIVKQTSDDAYDVVAKNVKSTIPNIRKDSVTHYLTEDENKDENKTETKDNENSKNKKDQSDNNDDTNKSSSQNTPGVDVMTKYGHLQNAVVKSGQYVKAGELIGYTGSTGNSTGPHIHYEAFRDGKRIEQQSEIEKYFKGNAEGVQGHAVTDNIESKTISSPVGWRIHPITGKQAYHSGTDIAADYGTPVYATHSGTVEFTPTEESGGYGNLVTISSNGTNEAGGSSSGGTSGGMNDEDFQKQYGKDLWGAIEFNRNKADEYLKTKGLKEMDYSDKIASGRLILDGTTAFSRDRSIFMTPEGVRNKFLLNSGVKQSDLYGYNYKGYYDDKGTFHETGGMKIVEEAEKKYIKEYGGKANFNKQISLRSPAEEKRQEAINKAADDSMEARRLAEERYEAKEAEKTGSDIESKNSVNISIMPVGGDESKTLKHRVATLETKYDTIDKRFWKYIDMENKNESIESQRRTAGNGKSGRAV